MNAEKIIDSLEWRYAVKRFDPKKKVNPEKIEQLLKMANLTATSLGIQPYKIVIIEDLDQKKSLESACFNQAQITSCSHLLLLCSRTDIDESYIDKYINFAEKERNLPENAMADYKEMCKGFALKLSPEEKEQWIAKQNYIVLGNLLAASALMQIDSCPMEGFNNKLVDEILDLEKLNLKSVLMLPLGYRHPKDEFQHFKKIRQPLSEMVINL